jgi:uncharacterized membrane protein
MIVCLDYQDQNRCFVVTPNRAMPWRQQVFLFSIIAAFSLGIGVGFFMQGLTLILPFAGFELTALAITLYISAWRGGRKEIIKIARYKVTVEVGYSEPHKIKEFDRAWLQIVLIKSRNPWYPSKLFLRSHGKQMEVGKFLNEEERKALAITLKQSVKTVINT